MSIQMVALDTKHRTKNKENYVEKTNLDKPVLNKIMTTCI